MLLLATDLDGTFLAGSEEEKLSLYGLFREKDELQLIFVTGRGVESVIPLLNDAIIPNPDYLICDVGATVLNGRNLEPVQPLQSQIERLWPGQLVFIEALKDVKGIRFQENPQERRCSFWFDEGADLDPVYKVAEQHNCDVLVSAGKYVDILPRGVNKGSTLTKLMKLIG
ncbi:MAG TPA: HAD family hydrolase, partial [Chitinophagaceae bacterium]|nr:HAD family hydrolase [Chitinophagaceae bacterium]